MATPSALSQMETSITGGIASLSNLLNLSGGPAAVAGFVAEGLFKAIKVGVAIRKAQDAANASLDAAVRAADVVRIPVFVNLDGLELQSFYANEMNLAAFDAFSQFTPELQEYRKTGGNPSVKTRRVLRIAMALVPALQDDPELTDHPELADIFAIGPDPAGQPAREIVLGYSALFPEGELPYRTHYDRLNGFWKSQLAISLEAIDQAQLDAQDALHQAIGALVTNAIFDPASGVLNTTLTLAKQLKGDSIGARIDSLIAAKKAAKDSDKASIQQQIDALTKWKARLG